MAVGVSVALSLAPGSARADTLTEVMMNFRMGQHIDRLIFEKVVENRMAAQAGRKDAPERPARPSLSATDFKPARKGHPTVDAMLATMKDAGRRRQLATAIAAVLRELAKERANNVATALAATLGQARAVVDGRMMSDEALHALLSDVNAVLAGSPDYAKLTAEQKQMLYEYLAVNATLLALSFQAAERDPEAKAAGTALARRFLQRFEQAPAE